MSQEGPQGDPGRAPGPPKKEASCGGVVLIVLACLVPPFAVVGVLVPQAVRRHLATVRAAEAKETVHAISRAVVGSYERNERVCGTASPVPATIPSGKYQPSLAAGEDFQKGSATEGWPCLGVSLSLPIYYQYEVRVGGNYKSVARGGYDPGPHGVEVSAEGDLDGDGVTTLFAYMLQVIPSTRTIRGSAQLFIVDAPE